MKANKPYSRSAPNGLGTGIQQHLESKPNYRKSCSSRDCAFLEANQVFKGDLCKRKKDGLDHKEQEKAILLVTLYNNHF